MLVVRWQAEMAPEKDQIIKMFENEGLKPFEENLQPGVEIKDCCLPFSEVRIISEGQMILNISGNQLLLRTGDKVIIPSNTNYSKITKKNHCVSIYAHKLF